MGRRETPVDPAAGPVPRFAYELRKLRQEAGGVTYRELARRAHFSVTALSQAAAGEQLPSLQVTLAYVRACDGDEPEWERRWQETEREVREATARQDDDAEPPYQGLARFEPDDHDRYFGRDRLVTALRELVHERRFTAVFGPSGSGKSSLLRAGLIPALRAERELAAIRVLTPGGHPAHTHADVLKAVREPAVREEGAGQSEGTGRDVLLVVDQFEEAFTLCRDAAERRAFIDLLLTARTPESRLRVVIAVRADFYGRCAEHRGLADALGEAGLLVGPMDPAELREVIVKPAQAAGHIVERTLTARLVEEIAEEPGGLPLLSHVLRETWRRRHGRALTLEAYEAAGGVHGAIAQTAEEVYAGLSTDHAELARLILLRLITPGEGSQDTRRPVDRAELDFTHPPGPATTPPAAPADAPPTARAPDISLVLDRLARARLITLDHDTVDLAHEALITAWPRLSGWIDAEREQLRAHRRLTDAARTWDELGRDPGALYRGTRLAAAEEQLADASLTVPERAFLTASSGARRGERRRRRGLVGALATLLVLALVAGAVAWQQGRTSDRRHVEAEARRIAAVADSVRFSDPRTAMRLSVAAARLADTTETRSALIGAMAQRDEDVFAVPGADDGFDGSGNDVRRVTADGTSVVSVTADRVRIWDLRTHRLTLSAPGPGKRMDGVPAAVGPDGRTLALLAGEGIQLWDVRTARVTRTLPGVDATQQPEVGFGGPTLAAADWNGDVHAWDLRTGRRMLRISGVTADGLAVSPDGRWLALCTGARAVQIWDVAHRRKASAPWAARVRPGDCLDDTLAFTPDSRTLTAVSGDGVRGWDLRTGRRTLFLEAAGLTQVWFGADDRFLMATGPHQLLVWRVANPYLPVLRKRLTADEWTGVTLDRGAGAVRYLSGSGTVVRSLSLGGARSEQWPTTMAYRAQLSGDGRILARSVDQGGGRRWQVVDTRSGRVVFEPPGGTCPEGEDRVCADLVALSDDGRHLARARSLDHHRAGTPDATRITVWDVRTHRAYATVDIPSAGQDAFAVNGIALDAHARTLVVFRSAFRPSVELWDLRREKRVRTVRSGRPGDSVAYDSTGTAMALRPDGDRLVTQDGLVADLGAGRVEPRVLGEDMLRTAAFSPDGTRLAVGDILGRVTLWDGSARTRLGVLDGSASDAGAELTGGVTALAFSHDSRTLAVADSEGTVRLWDVSSQRLLGTALPTPGDQALALAFGPGDGTLYASGTHIAVQKYDLAPDHLVAQVCARAGSGLSRADWRTYLPDIPYRRTC
ncbi:WD-40 repeat-containing protein [Streptomyces lincolnensis]|uniref:WD-40 repeat-containing protein n=1 Tax=Streptomyces lincolnensis TaxID=1915 RepID=A0A1B1MI41_STRLN|nr:DNA-binding protein [Streptomyces lincolnensis]ANS68197.1 WD-40 repeat-containing protein [Streptomyces lincolnensis]AXG53598.1 WD-40 repeat-containing protein [Streptomyces lincolnensis]QMV09845.1 DNA-binding protein [Streptomyces lincolnensis]